MPRWVSSFLLRANSENRSTVLTILHSLSRYHKNSLERLLLSPLQSFLAYSFGLCLATHTQMYLEVWRWKWNYSHFAVENSVWGEVLLQTDLLEHRVDKGQYPGCTASPAPVNLVWLLWIFSQVCAAIFWQVPIFPASQPYHQSWGWLRSMWVATDRVSSSFFSWVSVCPYSPLIHVHVSSWLPTQLIRSKIGGSMLI